jgi:glycosyltransferase involved in cell wall biosynthesis
MTKKNQPLFTIVTTVLNGNDTIERAILSVAQQTFSNFEYIIIDGLSADGTAETVSKYHNVVTNFISETDKGSSDALNKGFSVANGKWIIPLMCDDELYPNALENLAEAINQNPLVDIIFGRAEYIDHKTEKSLITYNGPNPNLFMNDMSKVVDTLLTASCFKKDCLPEGNIFDNSIIIANDGALFLKLFNAGKTFHKIEGNIVKMRTGGRGEQNHLLAKKELFLLFLKYDYPFIKACKWIVVKTFKTYFGFVFGFDHKLIKKYREIRGL